MATKLKLVEARVLTAIHHLGVTCEHVLRGTVEEIKALAKSGDVDPEPDAVIYAKSVGAASVPTPKAAAAEQAEAEAQAQADADAAALETAIAAAKLVAADTTAQGASNASTAVGADAVKA